MIMMRSMCIALAILICTPIVQGDQSPGSGSLGEQQEMCHTGSCAAMTEDGAGSGYEIDEASLLQMKSAVKSEGERSLETLTELYYDSAGDPFKEIPGESSKKRKARLRKWKKAQKKPKKKFLIKVKDDCKGDGIPCNLCVEDQMKIWCDGGTVGDQRGECLSNEELTEQQKKNIGAEEEPMFRIFCNQKVGKVKKKSEEARDKCNGDKYHFHIDKYPGANAPADHEVLIFKCKPESHCRVPFTLKMSKKGKETVEWPKPKKVRKMNDVVKYNQEGKGIVKGTISDHPDLLTGKYEITLPDKKKVCVPFDSEDLVPEVLEKGHVVHYKGAKGKISKVDKPGGTYDVKLDKGKKKEKGVPMHSLDLVPEIPASHKKFLTGIGYCDKYNDRAANKKCCESIMEDYGPMAATAVMAERMVRALPPIKDLAAETKI